MKQFVFYFMLLAVGVLTLTQCTCSKPIFQDDPPFSVSKSHYQDWVGGIPGVSGSSVHINLSTMEEGVRPDSLFFRQSKSKIDIKTAEEGHLWVGYFQNKSKRDMNMHAETDGEYGNKPPIMEKVPFELKENEAVISYLYKGKTAYYKLLNLEKMETQKYPAAKPRN